MPVDKCIPDTSLLAEILLQKYEKLKREIFSCDYVQADETTVPVINREKHKADKEYLWMVRSVMEKLVVFHYDWGSRAGAVIESLANQYHFKGYLQCNGFTGYETAFKINPNVRLLNYLVHIRHHFEQALDENREMAQHALTQIQHIYKIERQCDEAGLSYDERRQTRQELCRPIMEAMKGNHTIFRHDNFIGCFSADKIKMSARKYFCFNIPIYKNMAEKTSCRSPYHEEYIQTGASGNPEDLYH